MAHSRHCSLFSSYTKQLSMVVAVVVFPCEVDTGVSRIGSEGAHKFTVEGPKELNPVEQLPEQFSIIVSYLVQPVIVK